MEFSSIAEVWKYLRWLPKFVLQRIFNKERMADLILVDVRPRFRSVTANLGEIPSFEIWLQVINMSPFEVILEQAQLDLLCAGVSLKCNDVKKHTFRPGQVSLVHFTSDIGDGKANNIARHYQQNDSSISIHFEMNCVLHNFSKILNNLEGVNVSFLNTNYRSAQSEAT
jgi:hypothetical protein